MNAMLLAAALASSAAGAGGDSTGAAFLSVTPSARSYALGMSNAITSLGAQAIGANPANLGLMRRRFEAFSSYASLMDGTQYQHLAAAYAPSFAGIDAFGVSVTRLQTGAIPGADASGAKTGATFGSSDMAASLTGAFKPAANLHVGVSVKAIQSSLAGYRSNTAQALDLGATYTVGRFANPFTIGVSVTNLGGGLRYLDQTDKLPTAANFGVAAPLGPATAVVALNRSVNDRRTTLGTGLELALGPVALRAGLLTQSDAGNLAAKDQAGAGRLLNALSAGLGLQVGGARFDYAVSQQAVEFGPTQRIALSLQWGASRERAAKAESWKFDPDRSDWMIRSMGGY